MCTLVLWNDNPVAKVVGRSLDWMFSDEPDLWFYPRGLERDGHGGDGSTRWTSRYSSVVLSGWRTGSSDGINERGLAAHILYHDGAIYEPADQRPTLSHVMWVQWALDQYSTVDEVLDHLADVRITSQLVNGIVMALHFAVEDRTGDSAIIELVDGALVVHHGPEYRVMTNAPKLDDQLANLARYSAFGGDLPLPGDIESPQRFVRANYFLEHLPEPADAREVVAGVLSVIGNTAVPFGAPDGDWGTYPTWWFAAADITALRYYFRSTRSPFTIWVDLADLADSREVRSLNPRDPELQGEVSGALAPTALAY
ncbi:linear amide C-N hydrolase [Amnibacterium flavum]|uniref:Choloylglycine hydrolase n=1 Tax=Amnibacterium flavum TaxID=2173173 RepID=A0A2V1HPB8_9MICO|nr:linear amide C-N hydrolase [Amnibacterium flavum]PVZ93452.1 choloylglycine hydrolase [Amnibacterium flavum]